MTRIMSIRNGLEMIAALALSLTAQSAHAQGWGGRPYGQRNQVRQDFRNIRQDQFQRQVDRNRFFYDLNQGNTGAALNDINRLRADQRLLQLDRRQLQYDRNAYNPYYTQPPVQYVQQPPVQYVQQPQWSWNGYQWVQVN